MTASSNIPPIILPFISERAKETLDLVERFVNQECIPAHALFEAQLGHGASRWKKKPAILEELKLKARKLGLWNMFLGRGHGAGFTNVEYALMAEILGSSHIAPEATNNSAPDTGNMELLIKYGTEAQKRQWLDPLLEGKIRSAFLMTEPDVASSDAQNIRCDIRRDGADYIINGLKWWSSGAGDPNCELYIIMGKTSHASSTGHYNQHSVILVPANTPGITVHRMLSVFGYDDAPHGHGQISLQNVRVPASNIVLGEGHGFEIIQGRLGPGRIHHAMRTIGAAESALEWMIARVTNETRLTFGQPLSSHGTSLEWVAKSRIDIDCARMAVLNAAVKIDQEGSKSALREIAIAKVFVPYAALQVIDRAIQAWGAAGVCQDTPLPRLWVSARTIRIVDGPDEVHLQQLGRREIRRLGKTVQDKLSLQQEKASELSLSNSFTPGPGLDGGYILKANI